MTKTTRTITTVKTTFTVTLNSIIENYSTNMMEWVKGLHQEGQMDMFAEELASFSNCLMGLRMRHTVAIRELFGQGKTYMTVSDDDMDELELAEKNNEAWEIQVIEEDFSEIVLLDRKEVNW